KAVSDIDYILTGGRGKSRISKTGQNRDSKQFNLESGGLHIYGSSTDGKSTITKAACSVWGNPREVSKQWRTTDNALENEAELRNDSFLNLDELLRIPIFACLAAS
ncbi:DUF927 domain-containing protein, partial [Bacillus sp. D-CC]